MTPKKLSFISACKLSHRLQSQGKFVIFTSGCFDILHIGHIEFFCLIKKKYPNSVLIVGVEPDEYVFISKGANRPVFSQNQRIKVLSAVQLVDYVITHKDKYFDQNMFVNRFVKLRPNLIVYGNTEQEIIKKVLVQAKTAHIPVKRFSHPEKLASSSKFL